MLDICFKILDSNPNFLSNANEDCLSRKDPVYVSRVLSAMVGLGSDFMRRLGPSLAPSSSACNVAMAYQTPPWQLAFVLLPCKKAFAKYNRTFHCLSRQAGSLIKCI